MPKKGGVNVQKKETPQSTQGVNLDKVASEIVNVLMKNSVRCNLIDRIFRIAHAKALKQSIVQ